MAIKATGKTETASIRPYLENTAGVLDASGKTPVLRSGLLTRETSLKINKVLFYLCYIIYIDDLDLALLVT